MNGLDQIGKRKYFYKLYVLSPLCGKIVKNEYIIYLLLDW